MNCYSLYDAPIPAAIYEIPEYTFYGCESLVNFELEYGTTAIGISAFEGCYSLRRIVLPVTANKIYSNAFFDCTSIEMVLYDGTDQNFYAIMIDSGNDSFISAYMAGRD